MSFINEECELCENSHQKIIFNKGKIAKFGEYGELNIIQCLRCGHVVRANRRSYEEDKEFFTNTYHSLNTQHQDDEQLIQSQIKRSEGVLDFLSTNFPNNRNLLDVGCGHGYFMSNFIKSGYKCSGIDPDKLTVEYAKSKGKLDIKVGSAEELPYPPNSFDVVMSLGALEHVSDLKLSLNEIHRVLKKNGVLFLRMRPNRPWGLPYEYFNISTNRYFSINTHLLALYSFGFDTHQIINTQLEGRYEDVYITVLKSTKPKPKLEDLINLGFIDKPGKLEDYLREHYKTARIKAEELIQKVGEDNENLDLVAALIDKGQYKYPMFTGYSDTKTALIRSIKEADIILKDPWV